MMLLGFEVVIVTYGTIRIYEHFFKKNRPGKPADAEPEPESLSIINQQEKNHRDYEEEDEVARYAIVTAGSLGLFVLGGTLPLLGLAGLPLLGMGAAPIFKRAENSIRELKLKNDILNTMVICGSILSYHYIAAASMCLIFHVGTKFISMTRDHSQKILTDVFELKTESAWLFKDGTEIEVPINSLQPGDIVVISPSEVVPIDGVVVKGAGMIDQSCFNGESLPVEKYPDDQVFASTLLLSGKIHVRVEKAGNETSVAKLAEILNRTADYKTTLQTSGEQWADKAAAPLLASSIFVYPHLGLYSTSAFIKSSPGNSYRIWGSLLILNHIAKASRKLIVIKEGRALEQLPKIDTVVFDKTGTLTEHKMEVEKVIPHKTSPEEVLAYAALAEHKINHPLAKAIVEEAVRLGIKVPETDHSEYIPGKGVVCQSDNSIIQAGSISWFESSGIHLPEIISKAMNASEQGHSLVVVSVNNNVIGAVEVKPKIRDEVFSVVHGLRKQGIKNIIILSGDHLAPTKKLAQQIEADQFYCGVLPEEKAEVIQFLQTRGHSVCFVGDGINDVIAMKQADVSISLAGATHAAQDSAEIVFMDGTLSQLCYLFEVSHKFKNKLKHVFALGAGLGSINGILALFFGFGVMGSVVFLNIFGFILAMNMCGEWSQHKAILKKLLDASPPTHKDLCQVKPGPLEKGKNS